MSRHSPDTTLPFALERKKEKKTLKDSARINPSPHLITTDCIRYEPNFVFDSSW
jgi:hypothetical protein